MGWAEGVGYNRRALAEAAIPATRGDGDATALTHRPGRATEVAVGATS